jgi:hypothetical protein
VRAGSLTGPVPWDNRRKLHHLIVVRQCQHLFLQFARLSDAWQRLLDVICRNGPRSLGTWVPRRFCIEMTHTHHIQTLACLLMAST